MGRDDDEPGDAAPVNPIDEDGNIDPDDVPTMVMPALADPFERARLALRNARLARGMDPDAEPEPTPPPLPSDPMERAKAVLERSAQAREEATRGKVALEREARAKEELAELKSGKKRKSSRSTPPSPPGADPKKDEPSEPAPRKRRL